MMTSSPDAMVTQITEALTDFGLDPNLADFSGCESPLLGTSAAAQWSIRIAPNLFAELSLIRTSDDDHLLNLVTASETAHDEQR